MCVDSLPLMFYLWIKEIPQLGQWKPDTAVSRISCVWASHSFDSLYSSSKQIDICAKMGKKHKIRDHKMTHFDGGTFLAVKVWLVITWHSASCSVGLKVDVASSHNRHRFEKTPPSSQTSPYETGRSWLFPWSPYQLWKDKPKRYWIQHKYWKVTLS